jgi:TPR repeat protein
MIALLGRGRLEGKARRPGKLGRARQGRAIMMQFNGSLPAANADEPASAEEMFLLGMLYSSGREIPANLVTAHKWFNLAAMKGYAEAIRLRREIAAEMLDAEIGQAQRAARDWLKAHPDAMADETPAFRVAA